MRIFFLIFLLLIAPSVYAEQVPQTLDEAFSALDKLMTNEEKAAFIAANEESATLNEHQFGLGLTIRNEWLRAGKFLSL